MSLFAIELFEKKLPKLTFFCVYLVDLRLGSKVIFYTLRCIFYDLAAKIQQH